MFGDYKVVYRKSRKSFSHVIRISRPDTRGYDTYLSNPRLHPSYDEMVEWLDSVVGPMQWQHDYVWACCERRFYFKDEDVAAAFRLMWC